MRKFVRQVVLRGVGLVVLAFGVAMSAWGDGGRHGVPTLPWVWTHRPYVVRMAVTNRTAAARTVAKVTTSCACLTARVVDEGGDGGRGATALPGGAIPFELTLNPAGMEGLVAKRASVTFDDGSVETMVVEADVRTRLALSPTDAAFGVIEPTGAVGGRGATALPDFIARLVGCAVTNGGARIVGLVSPENPQFDVRVIADGLGVVVGPAHRADRASGLVVETWQVMTTDAEIPKIPFVVSVQFVNGFSVTPSVLTVDGDGRGAVGGRGATALPSRVVSIRRDDRQAFKVLSAETLPRKWGEVTVEQRPLNGWIIRVGSIDPNELRQFSKKPYLLVRTNCPEMPSLKIPMRVTQKGKK